MQRKSKLLLFTAAALALGLLAAALVAGGLKIPCPVRRRTGLQCPGCGNTRATLALLRLDFAAMLQHNLLYPVEVFYLIRVYIRCAKSYIRGGRFAYPAHHSKIDIAFLAVLLLWTVVRNLV